MKTRYWIIGSLLLLSLATALPVRAQTKQVVINGSFDTDVSSWRAGNGILEHTSGIYQTGPGGAEIGILDAPGHGTIDQCVDLSGDLPTWPESGGKKYATFSMYVKTDLNSGPVTPNVTFHSNTECTSESIGEITIPSVGQNQNWTNTSGTVEIPGTAQSLLIVVDGEVTGGDPTVYWADEIEVFSSGPTIITVKEFQVKTLGKSSIGLLALAILGLAMVLRVKRS